MSMDFKKILAQYNIENFEWSTMEGYESHNFKIVDANTKMVLKLYEANYHIEQFVNAESELLLYLNRDDCPKPLKTIDGKLSGHFGQGRDFKLFRLLDFLDGVFLSEVPHTKKLIENFGAFMGKLNKAMSGFKSVAIEAKKDAWGIWDLQNNHLSKKHLHCIEDVAVRRLAHYFLLQYKMHVVPKIGDLRKQVIHGDANDWNVLVNPGATDEISGIIDFGDCCHAALINELAVALVYVMFDKSNPLKWASSFIRGYHAVNPLRDEELDLLYYLIGTRLSVSLCQSAYNAKLNPDKAYISISEKQARTLLHQWIEINPIKARIFFREAVGYPDKIEDTTKQDLKRRYQHTSKAMSLTFDQPIKMTGAAFQYMYDNLGNTYLDVYNNIPQVGHEHPKVVEAAQKQMAQLNTNSRYLNEVYLKYTEALLKKFPEPLNKVFLLNSGSAASDLAIRLTRAYSANTNILVMEHGYHGNSQLGIDISDYKFNGKGGTGKKDYISIAALPETYRGKYSTENEQAGRLYAEEAIENLQKQDKKVAAFITECIVGCGGQVPLATGYLNKIFPYMRSQGGLCICDEVQTGFGRTGSYYWAFEKYRVVPDIVIIGKPMGNGHPIAGVVTTNEIAKAFETGMEFFSSFGGNPVSCAVGLAVLKVIEEEQLQQHAKTVGAYFKHQLNILKNDFDVIGEVRGEGLFLGIDLVQDKQSKLANTALAKTIKNKLKKAGILVGTDGPYNNVIKIKPPICFSTTNADQFLREFKLILSDIPVL